MLLRRRSEKTCWTAVRVCQGTKSLPLLRFSWSKCQYGDQSSANQLVFPCSFQENLTSAEQQGPMSQMNDK